ncbi:hypothetical protein [Sanyastnella coralliicola]|uniref:hypothetical protein n=1 Tax=Sanyastnella coralliicola TaxID=3069118 RepID=UPI0027B981BC|nr:hypothetical protein [Longitalea sp. SCSIO 12813]
MDTSLETLRNALLLALIVMLVYILYKRLVKKMGEKEASDAYAHIVSQKQEGGTINLHIEVPNKDTLKVIVFNAAGEEVKVASNSTVDAGEHHVDVNIADLASGKYSLVLTTSNHRQERPFSV